VSQREEGGWPHREEDTGHTNLARALLLEANAKRRLKKRKKRGLHGGKRPKLR